MLCALLTRSGLHAHYPEQRKPRLRYHTFMQILTSLLKRSGFPHGFVCLGDHRTISPNKTRKTKPCGSQFSDRDDRTTLNNRFDRGGPYQKPVLAPRMWGVVHRRAGKSACNIVGVADIPARHLALLLISYHPGIIPYQIVRVRNTEVDLFQ